MIVTPRSTFNVTLYSVKKKVYKEKEPKAQLKKHDRKQFELLKVVTSYNLKTNPHAGRLPSSWRWNISQ